MEKCPDWWGQRNNGKRFGIVLGIGILSVAFMYGCAGYWMAVAKRVDEKDKKRAEKRRKRMGQSA